MSQINFDEPKEQQLVAELVAIFQARNPTWSAGKLTAAAKAFCETAGGTRYYAVRDPYFAKTRDGWLEYVEDYPLKHFQEAPSLDDEEDAPPILAPAKRKPFAEMDVFERQEEVSKRLGIAVADLLPSKFAAASAVILEAESAGPTKPVKPVPRAERQAALNAPVPGHVPDMSKSPEERIEAHRQAARELAVRSGKP